jgi:hypothetical protein
MVTQEVTMQNRETTPAWLSPEDQKKWHGRSENHKSEERPALIPKPFENLPVAPPSAPAVTNGLPEDL